MVILSIVHGNLIHDYFTLNKQITLKQINVRTKKISLWEYKTNTTPNNDHTEFLRQTVVMLIKNPNGLKFDFSFLSH